MKSLAGEFGCQSNDLKQFFFLLQNRKISLCIENEMILSHRCPVFCLSLWFLSMLTAGMLARQESQMAKVSHFPPDWRKAQKLFENIQVEVIQKCSNQNYLIWSDVFSQTYAIRTKNDHRQITQKFNLLTGQFNTVQRLNIILRQNYEQSILLA